MTILISSHILGELSKLATRYGIINQGELIEEFTAEELVERCKSALLIKVDDVKKSAFILEKEFGTNNYKILKYTNYQLLSMSYIHILA